MKTTVALETMNFYAFHGVMNEERLIGGIFLADISYAIETEAVETDDIKDTVNYADLYDLIKDEMMKPSCLIEHVAGRILKAVKNKFPQIQDTTIKISKLNPPVNGEVGKAIVTVKE